MRQQCTLLNINRSSLYYQPKAVSKELGCMRLIDEVYTQHPFLGTRQMADYLQLQGYAINRYQVRKVYTGDITYCRLRQGFAYLVAIIDWFSRYVLGWQLSISLEADFCIETLKRVLAQGCCLIFNTDQGAQFTCQGFTSLLLAQGIKISMNGKGRALDNIFMAPCQNSAPRLSGLF